MADYRTMFDSDFLYAFHLQGREHTLTIARVQGGEVTGSGGKKSRKPLCYFEGKQKPLALNKTNCKTIAALYGNDADKWRGKAITIYPTTTSFGNEQVECVRVRPQQPNQRQRSAPSQLNENASRPADPESDGRDDQEPPEGALSSDDSFSQQ
jgi:hypothetical protein